jgi:hypothetical protein
MAKPSLRTIMPPEKKHSGKKTPLDKRKILSIILAVVLVAALIVLVGVVYLSLGGMLNTSDTTTTTTITLPPAPTETTSPQANTPVAGLYSSNPNQLANCLDAADDTARDLCYKDNGQCDKIQSESFRNICYFQRKECDKISSPPVKDACLKRG